jgi:hypothetical protein
MHAILTLVERDFICGGAVLINSLLANGYTGRIYIGYRETIGMPPKLLEQFKKWRSGDVEIDWIKIEGDKHFANCKPDAMLSVFEVDHSIEKVTYLDPDIVVECPWGWMDTWSDGGPVVCADVNWMMPASHPTRREWIEKAGLKVANSLDFYFNSGFLSLHRNDAGFASLWKDLTDTVGGESNSLSGKGDISEWRKGGRWISFFSPNQDTLNATAMAWPRPVVAFGPDAMGFWPGIRTMAHAVGGKKPWRRGYFMDALRGRPPRYVDKLFWANARKPLFITSRADAMLVRLQLSIASAIGRIYRRS